MEQPLNSRRIFTSAEWPLWLETEIMIDKTLLQNVHAYARQHQLRIAGPLGDGIHGSVWVVENKPKAGKSAVKAHRFAEPYSRELSVYERLREAKVSKIWGLPSAATERLTTESRHPPSPLRLTV